MDPKTLFSVDEYPAIEFPPAMTSLAIEIVRHNWWGRTQLHIQEGRERLKHLDALSIGIQIQKAKIENRIVELESEKEALEHANQLYLDMLKQREEVRRKEQEKFTRIEELRSNTVLTSAVKMHSRNATFTPKHPGSSSVGDPPPSGEPPSTQRLPVHFPMVIKRPALTEESSDDEIEDKVDDPDSDLDEGLYEELSVVKSPPDNGESGGNNGDCSDGGVVGFGGTDMND